jgi:hypothetical protein
VILVLSLLVVLSVLSNWAVAVMLRNPISIPPRAPAVWAGVPDVSLDWKGLI